MKKILTIIVVVLALQVALASAAFASGGSYHEVKYGETLYSIGRHYHVNPYDIADANGLYNPDHIYYGQVLYIPEGYGKDYDYVDYKDDYNQYHKVKYGETLYSIGRHYDVHPYHIAEANNLYNPNHIYYGQVLHIPHGSKYPGYGYDHKGYDHKGYDHKGHDKGYDHDYGSSYDHGQGYHKDRGCQSNCYDNYGYDYTGYYYEGHYPQQKRYSYTCGYYYNCW